VKSKNSQNQNTILIVRNAFSHDFGGGERFPVYLGKELKNHKFNPIIISRLKKLKALARQEGLTVINGWWWSLQNFSGIRLILLPAYFIWSTILCLWYIKQIYKTSAKTIHLQSRDDFIAGTIAGRLMGIRVIWTDHADLKYQLQNYSIWYKNPISKILYPISRLANYVTLVSYNEKNVIETHLQKSLPGNFTVIHNGVNDRTISPIARSLEDKNSIIFVATSRLVKAKGISELIAAFSDLPSDLDIKLWLLGEGPEEDIFKAQAASNSNIKFLGFPDNYLEYVAAADIFVHPSHNEGFSLSLVEAAMLEKPIIACRVGGNPEIIRDQLNGLLVPAKDEIALKQAMLMLIKSNITRQKYGLEARKTYEANFNFSKIVTERFLPLYEK
jgi:glycosyltransferase involved in cell wall biosynthesis